MKKLILFDLDGTLTDSGPGVKRAIAHMMCRMGYGAYADRNLDYFMGPPIVPAMVEFTGCTQEEAEQGLAYFHEVYDNGGIYENSVYPGIPWMLRDLKQAGCLLGVATSKPESLAVEVLQHFDLYKYFDYICGADGSDKGFEKADIVERAINEAGYRMARDQVILVGDRKYDVYGAGKCGITCVGAAFGYGGREELIECGADHVADTVPELNSLLLKMAAENAAGGSADSPERRASRSMSRGARVWDILYPIVYMLTGSLIASFIAAGFFMALSPRIDATSVWKSIALYSVAAMGIFDMFTIFFIGRIYRRDNLRFRDVNRAKWDWLRIAASVIMMVLAAHVLNRVIDISRLEHIFPGYAESAGGIFSSVSLPMLVVYVGILAPIAEELVFRGVLFRRLRAHLGLGWAIGISSVAFGIFHGNMIQFIYGTALGLLLALVYDRSDTLVAPILAHIFCNLFSIFGEWLMRAVFGENGYTSGIVLGVAAAAAAALFCALFLPRRATRRA